MISQALRIYVMRRDRRRCQRCGDRRRLEVDHVYPRHALRALGIPDSAHDDPHNLEVLCAACNATKSDRIPRLKEMRIVHAREEAYRMERGMRTYEDVEAHDLVLVFSDMLFEHCGQANDWAVWDNLEHRHGPDHWRSRVYIYALWAASDDLVLEAIEYGLADTPNFWIRAEGKIREGLGFRDGQNLGWLTRSAAEMAGKQLQLDLELPLKESKGKSA